MPAVEFMQFPISEEFRADPNLAKGAFDFENTARPEGLLHSYIGIQLEDNTTVHVVVVWESLQHHIDFRQHESHDALVAALKKLSGGPPDIKHVEVQPGTEVNKVFELGITEFLYVSVNPGVSNEDVEKEGALLEKAVNEQGIYPPVIWGQTVESKETFIMAIGWPTLQGQFAAPGTSAAQVIGKLRSMAKFKPVHAAMKEN